ncbi:MAG: type II toxin-antitoxin system Phd/YefM family antitoxin [Polyangiaceae bacterium]|nr:type II toxin-antitoxin system Phd/YefM family antitoxin [Polyangiaceae bacterium]
MRHTILSISKAKTHLLELARQVDEEGRAYVVTKDGAPLCALVPMEAYEAMLEASLVARDGRPLICL